MSVAVAIVATTTAPTTLNARIVYDAPSAGSYRIIATTLGDNEVGEFTLTVRESVKK